MCAEQNRIPKFSQFLVDNGDGSFSLPQGSDKRSTAIREGYWKTLIDFKMYENDGYGRTAEDGTRTKVKGSEQKEVTPNINMAEAYRVMDDYKLGRQMPNKADGTPGKFLPMESNNSVPVATPAGDEFIELIKRRREARKPEAPGPYSLEADLPITVKATAPSYEEEIAPDDGVYSYMRNAFGASQAPAVLGNTGSSTAEEYTPAKQMAMYADEGEETGRYSNGERFSLRVTDPSELDFLNNQETIKTYKTMQLIDGKLYPPMAAVVAGSKEDYSELGAWEKATEHPELIKGGKNFTLNKGQGKGSLDARYNPYMHSSNLMINDQFSGAYNRPELVTVECEVPVSEKDSGYHAELAKDSVGWHSWHTGTVAGALRQQKGIERQVFLSRWIKPVRIVPDSEVAAHYADLVNGTNIQVPDNVVYPALLEELKKAGVPIKESGKIKNERYSLYSLPSREVEEAAEKAFPNTKARTPDGKLMPLYHGTSADFTVFDTSVSGGKNGVQEGYGIYLTDNPEIPKQYGGRTISAYVDMERPAYADKKTFKRSELTKVIKAACEKEAQQFVDEGSYDNVKDAVGDTWISNYVYTPEYRTIDEAYRAVADLILDQNDNDSDIIGELLIGQGIRDYGRAMDFYHNILTPLTGFDGIWAKWNNRDTGEISNVLLAFDSSQIKSNEDVTYDNQGNPIPMGQRFDRSNPDIRYSLPSDAPYMAAVERGEMDEAAKYVKEYAASKGFDTSEKAYHGTPLFGFTRFDMQNSQDEIFVAYNPKTAGTYTFGGEVRDIASIRDRQDVSEMDADTFLDAVKKYIRKRPNSGGHGVISAKYVTADDLANIVSNQENFLKKALYGRTWDQATENVKSTLLNATKNAFGYYNVKSLMEDLRNAKSPLDYLSIYLDYLKNNPYENGNTPWPSNDSMNRGATVENALNILVNNYAELDNQIWQDYATYATRDIMQAYAGLQKAQNGEPLIAIMSSGKNSSPYTVYYTRSNLEDQVDMQRDIVGDSGIYQFYTRPGNQFVVDAKGALWRNISVPEISDDLLKTRDIAEWARENGYDSVRINNVYDNGGRSGERSDGFGDIGIFFNPMDVKSADTVTRDSDGNIIPLSERFDSYNADIRYSLPSDDVLERQIRNYLASGGSLSTDVSGQTESGNLPGTPGMGPQRQFGHQTAQESEALHDEVKDYLFNHSSYTPDSNQAQIDRALDWVRRLANENDPDGYYAALNQVTSDGFDYRSADGQARMLTVMSMAALKAEAGDRSVLNDELRLADAYNRQGTDLGRQLQARKIFRLMTPLGRVSVLESMQDKINEEFEKKGRTTRVTLTDETIREAAEARTEEDFDRTRKKAAKELAAQMPANWKDKLRGWRMLSMLGNPRTHIRNIVGNALFVPVVSLKNKLGAMGEIVTRQGERTKTLSPFLSKEIRSFAKQDALKMKDTLTGEDKYNETGMVERERKAFKGLLQAIADFNSNALEKEDWLFMKGHYKRALGGWMQANGYTADELLRNPQLLEQGRAYAVQEAQKATYRDFSKLASQLNKVSREGGVMGFIVDAALPFKKTPANILKRGLEYSPAGIIRSLTTDIYHLKEWNDYKSGKLSALPEKAISPNQFIDHLCSGLTGTAIAAVGALLGSMGIVSCGLDDDEDKLEKEQGNQEYSFKFSILGHDYTYTVDWAAPMSMPFFVGAAIQEQLTNQEGFDIEQLINGFGNITEPVFNLSMLDGVNTLFKTSQYDDTNTITQIGAKIGSNYATSYVPSLMGAIARTVDDTRRKAYVESGKGTGVMGTFRYAREQTENKIPGLSQTNIPYRDVFGNPDTSSLAERIIENFISPGYITEYKNDPVLNEMARLYDANVADSEDMVPKEPGKTITYNKEKFVLSAEDWDTYKTERGQTAYAMLTELINSPDYQDASEAAQVQMIKGVWSYADQIGKSAVIPDYEMKDKGPDPVASIAKEEKISSYESDMMVALASGDQEGYETMIEALHEEDVEDSEIKAKIRDTYRDQYKAAYRKGDDERMAEIESILDDSGFDFSKLLNDWEKDVDKKYGN